MTSWCCRGKRLPTSPFSLYQNPSTSPVNSYDHFALFKIPNSFEHSPGLSTLTHGPQECVYLVAQICLSFVTPLTVAHKAPLFMGIPQARILKWVDMPFSKRSCQPRDQTQISHIASGFFTIWDTREAHITLTFIGCERDIFMGYKRVSEVDWEQLWDISSATRVLCNSRLVSSLTMPQFLSAKRSQTGAR